MARHFRARKCFMVLVQVDWARQKVDFADDESRNMCLQLFQFLPIEHLKKSYAVERLVAAGFEKTLLKFRQSVKRTCRQCIFVTLHSRYVI